MSTFITRFDTSGPGVRLAVKDLIDMEGVPTTAGCRAVANEAAPAAADAAVPGRGQAAGARIVGRTNLHELALGVTGVNPWYGTPVNPLDPRLVPGARRAARRWRSPPSRPTSPTAATQGGRSGSPSACCGTAGLKTTWGRVPLDGVWPLAPSFDTVGPMAATWGGWCSAWSSSNPGFASGDARRVRVGRLRVDADPVIDARRRRVPWPLGVGGERGRRCPGGTTPPPPPGILLVAEAWETDRALVARRPG